MSYAVYDLYSHKLNKGELLSKILLYEFEHITNCRPAMILSLAAGDCHMMPISSSLPPPSVWAKQAYSPPVWSFIIQFGRPCGKHPSWFLW